MFRRVFYTAVLAAVLVSSAAAERLRAYGGFGKTLSCTTNPAVYTIEQVTARSIITNGYFASSGGWTTNSTGWHVTGGVASFTVTKPGTNNLVWTNSVMEVGEEYRITFDLTGIDPTTNSVKVKLGTNSGTVRTSNGTYTEDLYCIGNTNLFFVGQGDDTNSSLTIDNVYIAKAPEEAYGQDVTLNVIGGGGLVYAHFNVDGIAFTNLVQETRTMQLTNQIYRVTVSDGHEPIRRIWYRTKTGTATVHVSGY